MTTGIRSAGRHAALVLSALLVATASMSAAAPPVAATDAGCDIATLTSPAPLVLAVEVSGCGSSADASYEVEAEVTERATGLLVVGASTAGGGIDTLLDESMAVPVGGWYDLTVTSNSATDPDVVQQAAVRVANGGRITLDLPVLAFRPAGMSGGSYPAILRWSRAGAAKAARYQVQVSVDNGTWRKLGSTTLTAMQTMLKPGDLYAFRVRGISAAGAAGPWRRTVACVPKGVNDGSGTITYGGGPWHTLSTPGSWGGKVHSARAAGRSATLSFDGSAAAVVATVGPNQGSFRVYVDGVYRKTVSTHSGSVATRRVVYTVQWATPGSHRIRIVVVGTSGHPRVDLDGFLVERGIR